MCQAVTRVACVWTCMCQAITSYVIGIALSEVTQ